MSGWITVGLGAAAALCPLPGTAGTAVVIDTTPTTAHLVVCAADTWVEITTPARQGAPKAQRSAAASSSPPYGERALPAPAPPAHPVVSGRPAPRPSQTPLSPPAERRPPTTEPLPDADDVPHVAHVDDVLADTPAPSPAPRAAPFRWVPRFRYVGRSARPAPAGLSTTMTTVVITTPAILAAAALRPGSRRRGGG